MAHQAIQTKTMLKLWLPTGVPVSPVRIAKRNPANMVTKSAHCRKRFTSSRLMVGLEVKEIRVISPVLLRHSDNRADNKKSQPNRSQESIIPANREPADHERMHSTACDIASEAKTTRSIRLKDQPFRLTWIGSHRYVIPIHVKTMNHIGADKLKCDQIAGGNFYFPGCISEL
jgi:hypothetical protein